MLPRPWDLDYPQNHGVGRPWRVKPNTATGPLLFEISRRVSPRSTQRYHSFYYVRPQARRVRGYREPAELVEPAHARPSGRDAR
jgi:hypothetical protein